MISLTTSSADKSRSPGARLRRGQPERDTIHNLLSTFPVAQVKCGHDVELCPRDRGFDRHAETSAADAHARPIGQGWDSHLVEEGSTLEESDTGLGWADRETSPFRSVDKPLRIARRRRL
jgi:hypothetical protein